MYRLFLCVGHDTHLAGESPVAGVTAKRSEPQVENRNVGMKEVGSESLSLRTET